MSKTTIMVPQFPDEFQIGLIVGSSGSGKTTVMKRCFGCEEKIEWDEEKSIASHFGSPDEAIDKLCAVGLGSIPSWCKPYHVLSTGEKFRANLARRLHDHAVIDEFTSVVNRETAKSCSYSVQKYIRKNNLHNIMFASCHDDIINYLLPDFVYNTDDHTFYNGRYLQREPIKLSIQSASVRQWDMFQRHHYLSGSINMASKCYVGSVNGYPVAFVAAIAFPFKGCKNAWREHRLVVLPDYQGIGIGNAMSEAIAQTYIDKGYRYFSKTANPRCGIHRDNSPLWRPTSHNHKARMDYFKDGQIRVTSKQSMTAEMQMIHARRVCYSHEYVGRNNHPKGYEDDTSFQSGAETGDATDTGMDSRGL